MTHELENPARGYRGPPCSRCGKEQTFFNHTGLCEKCQEELATACPECGYEFYGEGLCDECGNQVERLAEMEAARYRVAPWDGPTLFLDTETTGLTARDRIVEIAMVDEGGEVLLNTLVNPLRKIPKEASAIHGITDDTIRGANPPTLEQLEERIIGLVTGRRLVIYNAAYDMRYLPERTGGAAARVECCMDRFASYYGEWHDYYRSFKWQSLGVAAECAGHQWAGNAHRALADAQACRSVWLFLDREEEKAP